MRYTLFLFSLFVTCFLQGYTQDAEWTKFDPKVKFTDFKAKVYTGPKAKVNTHSSEQARSYRTIIRARYNEHGVNFGGHYTFVSWMCGYPCQDCVVVDVLTGSVYDGPMASMGYEFRKNSKVLIVNPPDSGAYYQKANRWDVDPEIYIFNEVTKKFVQKKY